MTEYFFETDPITGLYFTNMIKTLSQPFSNIQMELLKLYAADIPDEQLTELKDLIAAFLFNKARDEADKIWKQKGYNENMIHSWLNEES